jgi:hypothetical protein
MIGLSPFMSLDRPKLDWFDGLTGGRCSGELVMDYWSRLVLLLAACYILCCFY